VASTKHFKSHPNAAYSETDERLKYWENSAAAQNLQVLLLHAKCLHSYSIEMMSHHTLANVLYVLDYTQRVDVPEEIGIILVLST